MRRCTVGPVFFARAGALAIACFSGRALHSEPAASPDVRALPRQRALHTFSACDAPTVQPVAPKGFVQARGASTRPVRRRDPRRSYRPLAPSPISDPARAPGSFLHAGEDRWSGRAVARGTASPFASALLRGLALRGSARTRSNDPQGRFRDRSGKLAGGWISWSPSASFSESNDDEAHIVIARGRAPSSFRIDPRASPACEDPLRPLPKTQADRGRRRGGLITAAPVRSSSI